MKNARALIAALAGVTLASSVALTTTATAAARTLAAAAQSPLGLTCQDKTSPDNVAYTFCTGEVPSFDAPASTPISPCHRTPPVPSPPS